MPEKEFLKECYILGTNQYDALEVWNSLDIGIPLSLAYEDKKVYLYTGDFYKEIKPFELSMTKDGKVDGTIPLEEVVKSVDEESKLDNKINIAFEIKLNEIPSAGNENYKVQAKLIYHICKPNKKGKNPAKKIGSLSEGDAKDLLPYLKANQKGIFDACVSYKDKDGKADENKRLKVVIRVIKK